MELKKECEFAIYYIPKNKRFYDFGSNLLGYNIKRNSEIISSGIYKKIQDLNTKSKIYGFHLTITDVVSIDEDKLEVVINRAQRIFSQSIFRNISLTAKNIQIMPNAKIIAIIYNRNFRFLLLHFLLVIFIQSLGYSSNYLLNYKKLNIRHRIKSMVFLSPYIFNEYLPHISLISIITDQDINIFTNFLNKDMHSFERLDIERIVIVVKYRTNKYFRILKELY